MIVNIISKRVPPISKNSMSIFKMKYFKIEFYKKKSPPPSKLEQHLLL